MIGFGLAWIPYINFIGGILGLVGVVLVWLGRDGFDDPHPRFVVVGGVLVMLTVVAVIFLAIGFAVSVVSAATTPGASHETISAAFQAAFTDFLVGSFVFVIIGGIGHLLIPWALSDRLGRTILWTAFAVSLIVGAVTLAILLPQVDSAIQQALAGSTVDPAPVHALQSQTTWLGLLAVFPSLLWAYAYYRARERVLSGVLELPPVPRSSPGPTPTAPVPPPPPPPGRS